MMGLRVNDGIEPARFQALAGQALDETARQRLVELGMIEDLGTRIRVTNQGVNVLNAVISEFLSGEG